MPGSDSDRSSRSSRRSSKSKASSRSPSASSKSKSDSRATSPSVHSAEDDEKETPAAIAAPEKDVDSGPPSPTSDPGRDNEVQKLKHSNEQLRKKLMQLNSQLDFELAQRGKGSRHGKVDEHKIARLRSQVEDLRRENETLKRQAYHADGICKATDLHNQVLQREQEIERLREANRGLDNVQRNQTKQMDMISQIESEKSRIRSAHNEELRALKERLRVLKEAREQDEKAVKKLQGQINQIEDKIHLSKGLKSTTNVRTLKDVEKLIADKEAKVQALTQTVEKLQRQIENERKRAGQHITARDVELLRQTLEGLKKQVAEREQQVRKAGGVASPLPSLTRPADDLEVGSVGNSTAGKGKAPGGAKKGKASPAAKPAPKTVAAAAAEPDDEDEDHRDAASDAGSQKSDASDKSDASHKSSASETSNQSSNASEKSAGSDQSKGAKEVNAGAAKTAVDPTPAPQPAVPVAQPVPTPPPQVSSNPHNPFGFARKRRGS